MSRIKVYIASPYTKGDHLENVNVQMDMYSELLDLGFLPFAPLYTHYIHVRHRKDYDTWMDVDYNWIEVCDVLLRLPGESGGADLEVAHAKKIGMPVFYSVEELLKWYEEKNNNKYMKFQIKLKDNEIREIEAINYEEKDGFFTFFMSFDLPGNIGIKKMNVASFESCDVKSIIMLENLSKEQLKEIDTTKS